MWHSTIKSASCDDKAELTCVPLNCSASDDSARLAPDEALRRQNTFLRGRVARLTEEQRSAGLSAVGAAEDLRDALGTLCPQLSALRRAMASAAHRAAEERRRAKAAEAIAGAANARAERLAERLAAEAQQSPRRKDIHSGLAEQNARLREELCALRARAAALAEARDTAEAALAEAKAQMERMAARLAEANTARDVAVSELRERDARDTAAARVEAASRAVVAAMSLGISHSNAKDITHSNAKDISHSNTKDITHSNAKDITHSNAKDITHSNAKDITHSNAKDISQGVGDWLGPRLDALLSRLSLLEGADLQLRQRSDEIAILRDERAALLERVEQLQRTLSNFSHLFSSMPQTPAELEETVLERDVLRSALHRCEERAEVPRAAEVQRLLELRRIEATVLRSSQTQTQRQKRSPSLIVLEERSSPRGGAAKGAGEMFSPAAWGEGVFVSPDARAPR